MGRRAPRHPKKLRPAMQRPLSRATSLWAVLRAVWAVDRRLKKAGDRNGARGRQIAEETVKIVGWPMAYTTVTAQLKQLQIKGLVTAEKRGHRLRYRPTIDEPTAVAKEIDAFLDNVLHHEPALIQMALDCLSRRLR